MKQITKILIIILIGSFLSGCVESDIREEYKIAMFDEANLRLSDNFIIDWNTIFDDEQYWEVKSFSDYPLYNNMLDSEHHYITTTIKHYPTIRQANENMIKRINKENSFATQNTTIINLTYGDMSYKIKETINIDNPDDKYVSIIILKDQIIGNLFIGGYSNMDECEEVADYYTPFLIKTLNKLEEIK